MLAITLGVFVQSRFPVLFLIPPALLMVSLELETFGAAAGVLTVEVIALASLFTKTGAHDPGAWRCSGEGRGYAGFPVSQP